MRELVWEWPSGSLDVCYQDDDGTIFNVVWLEPDYWSDEEDEEVPF